MFVRTRALNRPPAHLDWSLMQTRPAQREGDGWTVAHWAAQRGYEEMLSFIADRAPQLLTAQCSVHRRFVSCHMGV